MGVETERSLLGKKTKGILLLNAWTVGPCSFAKVLQLVSLCACYGRAGFAVKVVKGPELQSHMASSTSLRSQPLVVFRKWHFHFTVQGLLKGFRTVSSV